MQLAQPDGLLSVGVDCGIDSVPKGRSDQDNGLRRPRLKPSWNRRKSVMLDLWIRSDRASWVQNNFITEDTERIAAQAQKDVIAATTELAVSATRFDKLDLPYDVARKLKLLKLSLTLPAPGNAAEQTELTEISASLESDYGKGRYCPEGPEKKCLDINDMTRIMATSRNPDELLRVWRGWRTISPPMRKRYERLVELANKGARELGFADLGAMWRSKYDMPPDQFRRRSGPALAAVEAAL